MLNSDSLRTLLVNARYLVLVYCHIAHSLPAYEWLLDEWEAQRSMGLIQLDICFGNYQAIPR